MHYTLRARPEQCLQLQIYADDNTAIVRAQNQKRQLRRFGVAYCSTKIDITYNFGGVEGAKKLAPTLFFNSFSRMLGYFMLLLQ